MNDQASNVVIGDVEIEAYLSCPTKARLLEDRIDGSDSELAERSLVIRTHFRNKQRAIVEKTYRTAVCPAGISVEAAFAQSKAQIVFDVPVTEPGLRTVLHGVRF